MPYLAPTPRVVNKLEETTCKRGFGSTNLSVGLLQQKTGKLVFEGKLAGLNQKILFDSGADGNFITEEVAKKLHLRLSKPSNPTEITVATGQSLQIEWIAKGVPIQVQDYSAKIDFHVIPSKIQMVILGNNWFAQNNPKVNWTTNDITLQDSTIIKGNTNTAKPELNLILLHETENPEDFRIDP